VDNNVVTALAVGSSAVIGQLLTIWRERQRKKLDERNRKWDAEDRERKTAEIASALESANRDRAGVLLGKLAENTKLSVDAFREANQVNLKLSAVHDRIDGVVSDTNAALEGKRPAER
jgi:hypothetical protein